MKLFLYIFLSLLVACGSTVSSSVKPIFTLKDFRKVVEIGGKTMTLTGVERPVRLTLIPEKGVLMCFEAAMGSKKKWLHIYTLDSIKLIRSVINNGSEDGEMLGAFQLQYDNRNGGEIYITDIIKQQIMIYKADSLIAGNEAPIKIIGRPFHGYQAPTINQDKLMRSLIIDKSYNIVDTRSSGSNNSRMLLNKYRSDLSVRDSFGFYPKTTENILPYRLGQVLDGCLSISTDNKYIVFSGLTTDYLSVYDTSGQMIASAIGPGELDISYNIEKVSKGERIIPSSGRNSYAGKAKMNKGSIYILYDGKNSKSSDEHASDLLQFSSQLNPEVRYKLNVPVFDFEIDWRRKLLYGLRKEGAVSQLVIFKL
nr:BF3164 family lipoprotein [uncultured Sediminibacterium sp.]